MEVISSSVPHEGTASPKLGGKGKGKFPLLKQSTVSEFGHRRSFLSKTESVASNIGDEDPLDEGANVPEGEEEWRGLRLDTLRRRIQRLIVLMNLSEPGTIPNAGILASLVDLVSLCIYMYVCVVCVVCVCV